MKYNCSNCQSENHPEAKYCSVCGNALSVEEMPKADSLPFQRKPKKKQNIVLIAIVVICFWAAIFGIKYLITPSENEQLKVLVDKMNKACPIQFDPYTSLTNVVLLPNKTIQYNYTLSELTKAQINLDTVKKYVYPSLLKKAKESPDAKPIRDMQVTLKHHYVDKDGELVAEYVITPKMYK